jgi:hypothetical protein
VLRVAAQLGLYQGDRYEMQLETPEVLKNYIYIYKTKIQNSCLKALYLMFQEYVRTGVNKSWALDLRGE